MLIVTIKQVHTCIVGQRHFFVQVSYAEIRKLLGSAILLLSNLRFYHDTENIRRIFYLTLRVLWNSLQGSYIEEIACYLKLWF
jgi:hypothetical protein